MADAKLGRLERFFRGEGLDAAVVGVSGGVDSALVLALLEALSKRSASPLRRVVALLLPIAGTGATNQALAAERGAHDRAQLQRLCRYRVYGVDSDPRRWDRSSAAGLSTIVDQSLTRLRESGTASSLAEK